MHAYSYQELRFCGGGAAIRHLLHHVLHCGHYLVICSRSGWSFACNRARRVQWQPQVNYVGEPCVGLHADNINRNSAVFSFFFLFFFLFLDICCTVLPHASSRDNRLRMQLVAFSWWAKRKLWANQAPEFQKPPNNTPEQAQGA
eukprot:SAG31_NODE_761_length_12276_cov_4.530673_4_plen_144_part_00